jgi:drug/metabolite transporter (DMT)-like permease
VSAPARTGTGAPAAASLRGEALRGHGAMLLFAFLVAGSFSIGGMAAPHLDAAALNALRFALASALLGGLVLAGPGLPRKALAAPWRYLALGAALAVYFILMFEALAIADPVSTGAVFTLTPVMTAGFGWLLLRQVTTAAMAFALAVGAAGAVWVIFRGDTGAMLAFDIGRGEALFVIGCAGHALYTPLVRRLNRGEPALVFTLLATLAATFLIALAGARSLLTTDYAALPGIVWGAILYLAVFTTALTFLLIRFATLRLPAAKVMAYTYLVPSFVILWEAALGHGLPETAVLPGVAATAAALVILLGRDRVHAA